MADETQSEGSIGTGPEGTDTTPQVETKSAAKLTGAAKLAAARAAAKGAAKGGGKAPVKATEGADEQTEEPTARGPAARLCKQDDRATAGLKRFKLRTTNYGSTSYRYVLAPDRASAEACHLEVEGLAELPEGAVVPQVYCAELPD